MEDHHRLVELQSRDDLLLLIQNVYRAAKAQLDEAFPVLDDGQGEDEMRQQVAKLVYEYVENTFQYAAANISINGLPVSEADIQDLCQRQTQSLSSQKEPSLSHAHGRDSDPDQDKDKNAQPPESTGQYEPFDDRMRLQVQELAGEEEDLLAEIAALKQRVPAEVAARTQATLDQAMRQDEHDRQALLRRIQRSHADTPGPNDNRQNEAGPQNDDATTDDREDDVDTARAMKEVMETILPRQTLVEKTYRQAIDALAQVQRDIPAVVAKMERAREAGLYVGQTRTKEP